MSRHFDRAGRPMSTLEWFKAFEDPTVKRVASDDVGDAWISTVWIGLDHAFGDGPPLIFESMVFGGELDGECDRYSTEAEAFAGHVAMVVRVVMVARTTAEAS